MHLTTEITGGAIHPGRDALFRHVDAFRFVGRGPGRLFVRSLPLGTVTVATVESSGHDIALNEPSKVSFLVPLQGGLEVEARRGRLSAAADAALLLPTGQRTTSVRPESGLRFRAVVALAQHQAPRRVAHARAPGRVFPAAMQDAAASALSGYLRYLIAETARPDSPLLLPGALRASEALILDLFDALDGLDHAAGRLDVTTAEVAAAEARVRRAEEFMRANADEPLTMAEVAQAIGVGTRALQLAFRASRGATPRAVLGDIRLARARERLLAPDAAASVSEIALQSGFAHFGRFAAAYRARFGETPSMTLHRARR
jgi:AraC-like DNA-binding protein